VRADLSGRPAAVGRWFLLAVLGAVALGLFGAVWLFGALSFDPTPSMSASPATARTPAVGCPSGLLVGRLVEHELWGLAVQGESSTVQVVWPGEYGTRVGDGQRVLLDAQGEVLARTGDQVEVGGGLIPGGGAWLACGGVAVVEGR
jgi:hypothetical protein